MLKAVAGEYRRRGKPAAHTQWGLAEMHKYMQWQLANTKAGAEIGGFARLLPEATKSGPAPLPQDTFHVKTKHSIIHA